MSQFTSIEVKINNKEHLSTLLAEYGGDFEIKIWILDKDTFWTGELSSGEARAFITRFQMEEKVFINELKKALTLRDPDVTYSIEKKESNGHAFLWKRCLDTGIAVKRGEMRIIEVTPKEAYDEIFDRYFENNSQMHSQINLLKKERDALLTEKNEVLSSFEKVVEQKKIFEQSLYCQFLAILNTKKEKIRELQAELDTLRQSEGSRAERKKQASRRASRDTAEGEVDIATEVESARTAAASSGSSGNLLDSFEEVPSPVALLPKRSRFNPKETRGAKRSAIWDKSATSTHVVSEDEDADEDFINLL